MFQRILVPVDGSSTANLALGEAMNLAKECSAMLRIVHVVDDVNLNLEWGGLARVDWVSALRKAGEALLDKAGALAKSEGIQAQTKLLELGTLGHRVPEAIADEAKTWPADVIVIGTHGRRGLHHVFLGSVAEGVVRVATVPVLLIRGK